MSDVDIGDS